MNQSQFKTNNFCSKYCIQDKSNTKSYNHIKKSIINQDEKCKASDISPYSESHFMCPQQCKVDKNDKLDDLNPNKIRTCIDVNTPDDLRKASKASMKYIEESRLDNVIDATKIYHQFNPNKNRFKSAEGFCANICRRDELTNKCLADLAVVNGIPAFKEQIGDNNQEPKHAFAIFEMASEVCKNICKESADCKMFNSQIYKNDQYPKNWFTRSQDSIFRRQE